MAALTESVLVLNRSYMADGIINAKEALCLMFRGVAEAIDVEQVGAAKRKFYTYDFSSWQELSEFKEEFEKENYSWIQCVSYMLAVPTVIRLLSYNEYRTRAIRLTRRNLFARDRNICQYCGKKTKISELSLDHIVPKSRGGKLDWKNIVCACTKCNAKKANKTPEEAGMRLIHEPFIPRHGYTIPKSKYNSWKHFVDTAYWNCELQE